MNVHEARRPVAVIGAGAIGLSLASAFARAGRPITICGGRTPIDHIEITENGSTESWPVQHIGDPAEAMTHSTVIVAVKAHHTAVAERWLRAAADPRTAMLVAQNGIEHTDRVAPYTDGAHIIPGVVYLNAERYKPGCAVLRRSGSVDVSMPDDAVSRRLADELMAGGMRTSLESDLKTVAWRKLLANISASPLTALTGRRLDVLQEANIQNLALEIMYEAVTVGNAEGAALTPADAEGMLDWLLNAPTDGTSSMREDRLAGRPLEHDALTGAVVRAADRHSIATPMNRLVLALISAVKPAEREDVQK
ncbi:ketopantoate reductase family protein [Rhodococcus sp. NCIMB 12038]|uniref:ketopantoate reductase family protein n=1 Tax=Rhodococcus sp. NCIMB 12038 TaxID=933800 RepID=UPI000B3BE861|nr:2-dehydropantoate 2-reductase [Rhodococcus sp. NCIMB 12038]OUS95779.1 hypothetical protein CA951_11265 [Rhodococcus sp. NCIMB 12038]